MCDAGPIVGKHYTIHGKKVIAREWKASEGQCDKCVFDGSNKCESTVCTGVYYEEVEGVEE